MGRQSGIHTLLLDWLLPSLPLQATALGRRPAGNRLPTVGRTRWGVVCAAPSCHAAEALPRGLTSCRTAADANATITSCLLDQQGCSEGLGAHGWAADVQQSAQEQLCPKGFRRSRGGWQPGCSCPQQASSQLVKLGAFPMLPEGRGWRSPAP